MAKLNSYKYLIVHIAFCGMLIACSNSHCSPTINREWQMIDWDGEGEPLLDISLTFYKDGQYTDSRTDDAMWNFEFIEPDSLILYHHGIYEERYKILTLSNDSLILRLQDSLIHTEENEKEIVAEYGNSEPRTFKFIHKLRLR